MIRLLPLCIAMLLTLSLSSVAQPDVPADGAIPDTPAGKCFAAWLAAYNSGKRDNLRRYYEENAEKALPKEELAESHHGLFVNDGAFQVESIPTSEPTQIVALVRAPSTGYWLQITVVVSDAVPHRLTGFRYRHIPMPVEKLPQEKLSDAEIGRRLDSLINRLVSSDVFSGAVLVARNGKPIYQRAVGMANRAWKAPIQIDTRLNIASLSKMITAVAIMQLIEQGRLSASDTVGKILPDYPNAGVAQRITVQHLLTHTSGLGSKSLGEFRKGYRTLKEYLPSFASAPLLFAPGERYEYSNDGYLLLGILLEKVTGQDYFTYIREYIYKPAGMNGTDSFDLDTDPVNLAEGYQDGPGGTRRNNIFALPVKGLPFGLSYSTVEDMTHFAHALTSHRLLNAKSLATAWSGQIQNMPGVEYGYGFDVEQYNGTHIVGHSGGWAGITNQMDIYPDLGYSVVILTNIDDSPRPIAYKLREWLTQGQGGKKSPK